MEDELEHAIDLERDSLDPEFFAAALTVQHIRRLFNNGGTCYGRSGDEEALRPEHLERFVLRALENAQMTKRFELYWRRFQLRLPQIKTAWEKGQNLFQEDLTKATTDQGQMDYFSIIDFASDCYAYISAKNTYPNNYALQAWAINGYMLAWRQHFLTEEEE